MITKIETYGNFSITYDEDASQFVATHEKDETVVMRSKELKPLRTRIDNYNDPQEKKKRSQPKQMALQIDENHSEGYKITEVIVGAFGHVRYHYGSGSRLYAWVTSRTGSRRKRMEMENRISSGWRCGFFVEDTKENRDTIKAMQKIAKEKQAFIEKKDAELEKLQEKFAKVEPKIEELPEWEQ